MTVITNFAEGNLAAMSVWAAERTTLPTDELKTKFDNVLSSPVPPESAAHFPEFVYANRASFSTASKKTAADVCDFATSMGFYGLGQDQRGTKISAILRGGTAANGPVPLAQFSAEPVADPVISPAPPPPPPAPAP